MQIQPQKDDRPAPKGEVPDSFARASQELIERVQSKLAEKGGA